MVRHLHGDAVLWDAREDIIEQCGEVHECVTDPEVSEAIGYCKADTEDISFTLCDRGASESPCGEGEVCKIGTIDPEIGVCAEVTGLPPEGGEAAAVAVGGGPQRRETRCRMLAQAGEGAALTVCWRVLTTSTGQAMPCETAAQTPPASAYCQPPVIATPPRLRLATMLRQGAAA